MLHLLAAPTPLSPQQVCVCLLCWDGFGHATRGVPVCQDALLLEGKLT